MIIFRQTTVFFFFFDVQVEMRYLRRNWVFRLEPYSVRSGNIV